ncbi:MAG: N5-glutamine methyltransferase family protein [Solirubrobacterales bacterium]
MASVDSSSGRASAAVADLIDRAAETIAAGGCEEPRPDAEALVANALGISIEQLASDGRGELPPAAVEAIEAAAARRAGREPMAYILGRESFRQIELQVDERVLIPRRETELLVEAALELPEGARVHEVGTGSGAVSLALLTERPDLRITASDISPEAVEAARENAARLGLALEIAVAAGLPDGLDGLDMVVANLPYVTDETVQTRPPEIRREPRVAVITDPGVGELDVIRGVVAETPSGCLMALEHDAHHGATMRELLSEATTMRDYMGDERATVGRAP